MDDHGGTSHTSHTSHQGTHDPKGGGMSGGPSKKPHMSHSPGGVIGIIIVVVILLVAGIYLFSTRGGPDGVRDPAQTGEPPEASEETRENENDQATRTNTGPRLKGTAEIERPSGSQDTSTSRE